MDNYSQNDTLTLDITDTNTELEDLNMTINTTKVTDNGPADFYYNIFNDFSFYSLALIIPVGMFTNVLSLTVFFRSSMRKTSTGHYLISLAFADLTLLSGELLLWLHSLDNTHSYLGIDWIDRIDVVCKLVYFIRYLGRTWSSWVIVIITIERLIIVRFPLHVHIISTTTKAKIICVLELAIALALSSYPFYTVGVSEWEGVLYCIITDLHWYNVMSWIVIRSGNLMIAGFIVAVVTAIIIYHMATMSRDRRNMAAHGKSKEAQMTRTLIVVAVLFVFLRLPYVISYYLQLYQTRIWSNISPWGKYSLFCINQVANVLAVLNYAINFFLYCLCGSAFRRELGQLCCNCSIKRYLTPNNSQHTALTQHQLSLPVMVHGTRSSDTSTTFVSSRTPDTSPM